MTAAAHRHSAAHQRWCLDDIPWQNIDRATVADNELLFYLVTAASFIETATDTYTRNLIQYFSDDAEVGAWLQEHWQHEELQHGQALKRYAQNAWPGFDWERVYAEFFAEFSATCLVESLEPGRSLEMASRCIVEMGTSSYYTALSRLSPDPVLAELTRLIREDEVRHYKYFYRYFCRYREREHVSRWYTFKAILHRLRMIDGEDSSIAVKHVYAIRHPGVAFDQHLYRSLQKRGRRLLGGNFPHTMSVKMTLKPLNLNPRLQNALVPCIGLLSRWLLWGETGRRWGIWVQTCRRFCRRAWSQLRHPRPRFAE